MNDWEPVEEAVAKLLTERGLQNVQVLKLGNAHPYVYGEWLKAPGKPTLLLYAHHDVQPPGREELWKTPAFEPTEKDGPGGKRLFARGAADDKAGIIVHAAAIASYLDVMKELPLNVKVIIEGEEEIGSTHLEEFLQAHRQQLDADILVLTDTMNFDCGVPALTVALRGLVGLEVEVRALDATVHSGMWGGPVPDPAMALTKMLAGLVDEDGKIAVPGVLEQVKAITAAEKKEFDRIPYDEATFRKQAGLRPTVKMQPEDDCTPFVQLFKHPSLTINAIQASSRKQAGNVINDAAWAKVTIRLVPDMSPEKVMRQLQDYIKSRAPWGVEVNFKVEAMSGPWTTEPVGTAFEAADVALQKGYGKAPYKIGCGGSIPFVEPFAKALGGAPAILIGVEDPYTNAHGENESLLISDLEKACVSQVYLFAELANRWRKK
jgi:acetylornithine deacetylase/succinyl-diaminopimelate desuccinylase-like protein